MLPETPNRAGKRAGSAGNPVTISRPGLPMCLRRLITRRDFTDLHGIEICWSRAEERVQGIAQEYRLAAQVIAADAAKKAQLVGMKAVEVGSRTGGS